MILKALTVTFEFTQIIIKPFRHLVNKLTVKLFRKYRLVKGASICLTYMSRDDDNYGWSVKLISVVLSNDTHLSEVEIEITTDGHY